MSEHERTPYPKYQACPCGSGQKYKFCCYTKGFHYYVEDDEKVSRSVPMTPEMRELIERRRVDLEKKLGRPLRPDDQLFPELAALSDEEFKTKTVADFRRLGVRPVLIHAYEKTGLMVTDQNKHLIPDIDLAAWDAAVEEYYELHPEDDPRAS